MLSDGILSDLVVVEPAQLQVPAAVAPWDHLPVKLYRSATATRVFRRLLGAPVPGTPASYSQILDAIMQQQHVDSFCYLIGGQVRDLLTGRVSKDVDFNYACSAQDVARVCIENEWTVKYKCIGPVSRPNYVLIGDESKDDYMEGFSISFNATSECFAQDFRQNMLFYDLTNDVILDKSGYGIEDIRSHSLRLACAPASSFEDWAGADMTLGQKGLRYVKFVVRAQVQQRQLNVDEEESKLVAALLRRAFRENAGPLQGFWFGYVLGECLGEREGVEALFNWVCKEGGASWWAEWLPFVAPKVSEASWLKGLGAQDGKATVKSMFQSVRRNVDDFICHDELKRILGKLDGRFSEAEVEALLQKCPSTRPGWVRHDDFVDYVFG